MHGIDECGGGARSRVIKLRFRPKGGVQLHPPRETEEEEELYKLWRCLCEELQGKHQVTQMLPRNAR